VSEDLSYFAHVHPVFSPDGLFRFQTVLPMPGPYRVVSDFFPVDGTPQMTASTIYVAGKANPAKPIVADLSPQRGVNLEACAPMRCWRRCRRPRRTVFRSS
jgi:hypothetical protein